MVTLKDIFIEVAIIFFWFFTSVLLAAFTEYHFLLFLLFIISMGFRVYLKRRKKIIEFVRGDFSKLGYDTIEERPLSFKEFMYKFDVRPTFLMNDVPLSRYKYMRAFSRIFIVKHTDGKHYELNAFIAHKWNEENKIKIIHKKRFRN